MNGRKSSMIDPVKFKEWDDRARLQGIKSLTEEEMIRDATFYYDKFEEAEKIYRLFGRLPLDAVAHFIKCNTTAVLKALHIMIETCLEIRDKEDKK